MLTSSCSSAKYISLKLRISVMMIPFTRRAAAALFRLIQLAKRDGFLPVPISKQTEVFRGEEKMVSGPTPNPRWRGIVDAKVRTWKLPESAKHTQPMRKLFILLLAVY